MPWDPLIAHLHREDNPMHGLMKSLMSLFSPYQINPMNYNPLREVLEQEIGLVRQRLAIVKAQASDGPEAAHKAAPVFRSLVRDLERVRRISESAALSFSGVRVAGRMPRTKSEAYDALGVNADVSAETLKKLVDALRMCWHPDLARDEQDRLVREERIKCINVSWELISGKRAVG